MIRGHALLICIISEHSPKLHTGLNKITYILTFAAFLMLAGCSIDGYDNTSESVTQDEVLLAGQIIGESISENQGGMLSTFSEAFAVPTPTGLTVGPSLLSSGSFRNHDNFSHSYDTETGEHHVTYVVRRENPLLSSSTDVKLTYIFYDAGENPIEFPEQEMNRIEAVDFSSNQSGSITTGSKNSIFSRADRILMYGLTGQSETLTIDGFHSAEGVFSVSDTSGNQIQREYTLDMNYLDIRIDKSVVLSNRNFRNGVNGALSYESTVKGVTGASEGTKIVNGTVELNGDGTALLNFRKQIEPIRLRLDDGNVFDDDEFEGRITRVDIENSIFTIANGQRIEVNSQTDISDGDYQSLSEVATAIAVNQRIVAKGDYFQPDENVNLWVATEVEFEAESNEFEDLIESINTAENSLKLVNGDTLYITNSSSIEFDDDLASIQDVADAIEAGLPVFADGEFSVDPQSGNRIVVNISFEIEFDDFESTVIAADSLSGVFTLANDRSVKVTSETEIEGDYNSIANVQLALEQGMTILADGEYYLGPTGDTWIAVQVSFELEEGDGNGSGDGDDDDGNGDNDDDGEED